MSQDKDREALELAQEALEWHAARCGEDAMPDATVEALTAIRAALATQPPAVQGEPQWLPIETAPKGGEKFLAWRRHSTLPLIVFYNEDYDQYESNEGNLVFSLTHWMPLPPPPGIHSRGEGEKA